MKKNPKPLTILCTTRSLYSSPAVQALREKGHIVAELALLDYDIVVGPDCWRIDPAMGDVEKLLELMLKGVRAIKYPKTTSNSGGEKDTPSVS